MTDREYSAELASLRSKRVTLLKAFQSKLAEALIRLPADEAKWSDVIAGLRLLGADPLSVDEGDEPSQQSGTTPLSILRPNHERQTTLQRTGHHARAARRLA